MPAPQKERLYYFDVIKGIAIYMVVMGHVLFMCMDSMRETAVMKMIANIHMPLFFFISGWFTYRLNATGALAAPNLKKRFMQLVVPVAFISALFIMVSDSIGVFDTHYTYIELWMSNSKGGYWFNICLFEIILLYYLITKVISKCKHQTALTICLAAVLTALFIGILTVVPAAISDPIEASPVATYLPVFVFGVIASKYRDLFDRLTVNGWWMTAMLVIVTAILYVLIRTTSWKVQILSRPLLHIALAFVAVAIFKPWAERHCTQSHRSAWARLWLYLGRNSLAIYLLHYFFLFPLQQLQVSLGPIAMYTVPELLIAALAAGAIITCTCGAIEILRPSKPLSRLLTGA